MKITLALMCLQIGLTQTHNLKPAEAIALASRQT
jgi:hypothetical protein